MHNVWILDCKHCHSFLTNRGMKAVLLLRPNVPLYSTDAMPVNCSAYSSTSASTSSSSRSSSKPVTSQATHNPNPPRTCECLTQTLCCHGCGTAVGYMIVVPCIRCTSSVLPPAPSGPPINMPANVNSNANVYPHPPYPWTQYPAPHPYFNAGTGTGYSLHYQYQPYQGPGRVTNGHRFVFHSSEIRAEERLYISGEPGIVSFDDTESIPSQQHQNPNIHDLHASMRQLALTYTSNSAQSHPITTQTPTLIQGQPQTNLHHALDPAFVSPELSRAMSPNSPSSLSTSSSGSGGSISGSSITSASSSGIFDPALSPDLSFNAADQRYLPSPPPDALAFARTPHLNNNNLILNSPAIVNISAPQRLHPHSHLHQHPHPHMSSDEREHLARLLASSSLTNANANANMNMSSGAGNYTHTHPQTRRLVAVDATPAHAGSIHSPHMRAMISINNGNIPPPTPPTLSSSISSSNSVYGYNPTHRLNNYPSNSNGSVTSTRQKLKDGDILHWHDLVKSGELPPVMDDERARASQRAKITLTTGETRESRMFFGR